MHSARHRLRVDSAEQDAALFAGDHRDRGCIDAGRWCWTEEGGTDSTVGLLTARLRAGILPSDMLIDLTKLSEDELIELNRRIVERLQLLRSAKSLNQLARFSVGMVVEFNTDDGRTVSGMVARLNRQTATIVTASGRWRVSPSLLRVPDAQASPVSGSRIVSMPPPRRN